MNLKKNNFEIQLGVLLFIFMSKCKEKEYNRVKELTKNFLALIFLHCNWK